MNSAYMKEGSQSRAGMTTFMSSVWSFFGMAILIAALGAWAGQYIYAHVGFLVVYGVFMAAMLTSGMWMNSKTFRLPMFVLFAFLSGTILYPTLAFAGATGQIDDVVKAFVVGGLTFFIAAIWGYTTKKDLSGWGNMLAMAMFGLFAVGIVSFIGGNLMGVEMLQFSSTASYLYSGAVVVLFTVMTSYDIQNVKNGLYGSPLSAAFHMYFNLFAIIQSLLNIFLGDE